ncbi:MAG: DUF4269 domain-containing protein [Planctomycetota bacterium]|nr:MAG: DUF4269 domain-containing protein [Planctomycetota bacterium]
MPTDFLSFDGLREGTPRQRQACAALSDLRIAEKLAACRPVLCGTIPIDIDIDSSDLDLICQAPDPGGFIADMTDHFGDRPAFSARTVIRDGLPTAIVRFRHGVFDVELFAQDRPAGEQRASRHMIIEARLLELGGTDTRTAIRALKQGGLKTEPAFGAYFNLPGDPYETLLRLYNLDDAALRTTLNELA